MNTNDSLTRHDLLKKAVLSNAEHLSKFLISSILLLMAIIVVRSQSNPTFKIPGDVEIRTGDAWIVVLVLTVAHFVCASYFAKSVFAFAFYALHPEKKHVFDEITITGPLIYRGMQPRQPIHATSRIYAPSPRDPTTWLYLLSVLLVPLACIPLYREPNGFHLIQGAVALYLLVANWIIGSCWVSALGYLAGEHRMQIFDKAPVQPAELILLLRSMRVGIGLLIFYLLGFVLIATYVYMKYFSKNVS